eukprot:gene10345-7238_t
MRQVCETRNEGESNGENRGPMLLPYLQEKKNKRKGQLLFGFVYERERQKTKEEREKERNECEPHHKYSRAFSLFVFFLFPSSGNKSIKKKGRVSLLSFLMLLFCLFCGLGPPTSAPQDAGGVGQARFLLSPSTKQSLWDSIMYEGNRG